MEDHPSYADILSEARKTLLLTDLTSIYFANFYVFFSSQFSLDKYSLNTTASFNLEKHLLQVLVTMAKSFNY